MSIELFAVALKQLETIEETLDFAYSTIPTDEGCEDVPFEIEMALNTIKELINNDIRNYSAE